MKLVIHFCSDIEDYEICMVSVYNVLVSLYYKLMCITAMIKMTQIMILVNFLKPKQLLNSDLILYFYSPSV